MPTFDDLKQMQALPLELKIIKSQQRIKEFYSRYNGMVYVSFSGGKDSTVLKHLVETSLDVHDVPSVFVNTGLEFPEIQKFAMSQPNTTVIRPAMRFDEVIKKYGYPVISKSVSKTIYECRSADNNGNYDNYSRRKLNGELKDKHGKPSPFNCPKWAFLLDSDYRISHYCCNSMKKNPLHAYEKKTGRKPFVGTLAEESNVRTSSWLKTGCNAFGARPLSKPLSFWTEQDILEYIQRFKVPYCVDVYGDIIEDSDGKLITTKRRQTGCIFCAFGIQFDKSPNRFQQLQRTHPRQYEYCMGGGEYVGGWWQPSKEGLGLAHVLDALGIEYETEPDLFDE